MHVLLLYRVDKDIDKVCKLSIGEHVIGRGPLLECTSKKVSRNHGLIRVTENDGAFLISTHHNPCFLLSNNTKHMTVVKNGTTVSINDGDKIALLPDEYWFRVQYVELLNNENNNVNQRQVTEAPNDIRSETSTNNITIQHGTIENEQNIGLKREHSRSDLDETARKRKKSTETNIYEENKAGEDVDTVRVGNGRTNPNLLANCDLSNYGLEMEQNCNSGETTPDNIAELNRVTTNIPQVTPELQTTSITRNSIFNSNSSASTEPNADQNIRSRSSTPDILEQEANIASNNGQRNDLSSLQNDFLSSHCNIPEKQETSNTHKTEENITCNQSISNSTKENNVVHEISLDDAGDNDIDLLNQSKEVDWSQSFEEIPQQDIVTQQLQANTTIDELANLLQSEVQQMNDNDDDNEHFEDAIDKTMPISNQPDNTKSDEFNQPDGSNTELKQVDNALNQPSSSNQKTNESNIKNEIVETEENVVEECNTDDEDLLAENEIKTEPMEEVDNQVEDAPIDNNEEEEGDKTEKSKDKENEPNKDQPSTSGNSAVRRERCWYGSQCYRKNMTHKAELSHPGDADYDSDPNDPRPVCSFGAACYRKNKLHRQQFQHPRNPGQTPPKPPNQKRQRKRRKSPINNPSPDSEDDYDYSDPFLNDGSSDDYQVSDDSDSDDDYEEGLTQEDSQENRQLLKEAKKFTRGRKKK